MGSIAYFTKGTYWGVPKDPYANSAMNGSAAKRRIKKHSRKDGASLTRIVSFSTVLRLAQPKTTPLDWLRKVLLDSVSRP